MGKLTVKRVMDGNLPYEEITELLHASYKEHADHNRDYMAAKQSVEQTKKRFEGNYCVLVYDEDKLVGTIAYRAIENKDPKQRKWYEDDFFAFCSQAAIHPDYRKTNAFVMMVMHAYKTPGSEKCKSVIIDTSVEAKELVEGYVKCGFQIVDMVSWPTTGYYSYIFRSTMHGKKYSNRYCKFRFYISAFLCKLRYKKNGRKRFGI